MTALQDNIVLNDEDIFYHQALISSFDDIIISTDKDFIIKTWNAAAERLYEVGADEATGKKISELIFHQYINTTREEALKKLLNENCWKGFVRVITPKGNQLILHSIVTIVSDHEKRKLGFVSVSRNVTDDLQNRQPLKSFSSVLSLLDESSVIIDHNYKIVFLRLKGKAQNFFNHSHKIGDDILKYEDAAFIYKIEQCCQKAFKGETIRCEAESGTEQKFYFDIAYVPLKNNAGIITNVCLIVKDLTVQKKEIEILEQKKADAENSMHVSRKFFEDFMENTHLLAWVVDEEGCIHYMNSAYADFFKLGKPCMETKIFELYPAEIAEEYLAHNKEIIETGAACETIENRLTENKTTYKIIRFPIFYKNKIMVAGWGVDISDQIAMQKSLSLLNQNKNKIMSVIAHDISAPLGSKASFINTIIEDYEKLTQGELLHYLGLLKEGISKCFDLTEELLLWGKSQLETIKYTPCRFESNIDILRITETLLHVAQDKKIIIETQLCDAIIYGDQDMFAIVLRNFISNAIKFSKARSTIIISTEVKKNKLFISVKDTGVGMKKELAEKLLSKLNYESSFGTKGEKGAGLGLIIAKDFIEHNKGEMYIESEPGKGSVFCFTMRIAQ